MFRAFRRCLGEPTTQRTRRHDDSPPGGGRELPEPPRTIIRGLTDALEHGKKELARRSDALCIKEMLQASYEANRRLSEVRLVQEEFRCQTDPTNTELHLEVSKLTRKLELAQHDLTRVEAEMSSALAEQVAMLQVA
ncbi:hypothetical protein V8E54_005116 [Elaphomyces granulatus]